jgi:hypothetical protein
LQKQDRGWTVNAPRNFVAVAAVFVVMSGATAAQQGRYGRVPAPPPGRWQSAQGEARRGSAPPMRNGPHGGEWLRQNRNLPPAEQMKKLQQDPAFRRLPPEQQQRLVNRLKSFNNLPPEKQDQIIKGMDAWSHFTPEQQEHTRALYNQMRGLPQERQNMVRQAARNLRFMPPEARQRALNSPEMRNAFSDQERELLRGMSELGTPVPRPPAPPARQ